MLLHASAVGKTILAYLPKPERDRLLATQPLTRFTETTITEPAALEAEFESIRTRGWTADDAEHRPYVVCVAVPIRDARGAVRAALSVTAVKLVATLDDLEAHVPLLLDASAAISADLGHDAHTATA